MFGCILGWNPAGYGAQNCPFPKKTRTSPAFYFFYLVPTETTSGAFRKLELFPKDFKWINLLALRPGATKNPGETNPLRSLVGEST